MEDQQILATLAKARAILQERGHSVGTYEAVNGRICMARAIGLACGDTRTPFEMSCQGVVIAPELLGALGFECDGQVCNFNNTHTEEQVLARFDAAIESLTKSLTHSMRIMEPALGDEHVSWDPENPTLVKRAKAKFDKAIKAGKLAYKVDEKNPKHGEQITEFDPSLKQILIAAPLSGG